MGDKQELPAKVWQVDAVEKRLAQQERFNERIESKLDNVLQNLITSKQFEDRITSLTKTFEDKLITIDKEINLKYGPLSDSFKWVSRLIIATSLAVIGQLIVIVVNIGK